MYNSRKAEDTDLIAWFVDTGQEFVPGPDMIIQAPSDHRIDCLRNAG
jgi:hypothetical protein